MSDLIERLDACDARDTPRLAQDILAEASAELTRLRSLVDQSGGGAATAHACKRCADRGEVGYFDSREGGWRAEPCPDCNEQPASDVQRIAALIREKSRGGCEVVAYHKVYAVTELAAREIATEILTASPPHGGRILEGWRMVPVEPDHAMLHAPMVEAWALYHDGELDWFGLNKAIYKAMLSAAPVSPLREGNGASRDQSLSSSAACVADATTLVPQQVKP